MPDFDEYILELEPSTIGELDNGMFGKAIQRAIDIVQDDIINRPANAAGKAESRKVQITLTFTPRVEYDSQTRMTQLVAIDLEPQVRGDVPPVRGLVTDVRLRNGRPHFNRDCPANFSQRPLYGDDA